MDKLLKLTAFGDLFQDPAKKKGGMDFHQGDAGYGNVYKMILQNPFQAKLAHWQCHLYGQHKALDSFFEELIDLGDNLAETVMGKYGKPTLSQEELNLELKNYENAKDGDLGWFMDHLVKCYSTDCRKFFDDEKDSEIVNIIDEISALVNKTKYLVSLR